MFYLIVSVILVIAFIVIISIVRAYIFDHFEDKRYFKEMEEFYNEEMGKRKDTHGNNH